MFKPNDDVVVQFDGDECPGEVLEVRNGWILARVLIDPDSDYGTVTPRLDPISTVMVREQDVRHKDVDA